MADDQIFGFDENSIRRICADVMRGEREARGGTGGSGAKKNADPIQWQPFRNDYSGECPARSVIKITGHVTTSSAAGGGANLEPILTCTRPDTDFVPQYAVSWGNPVSQDGFGLCAQMGAVPVAYDTGTPATGEGWGPKPSQFTASKGYPGFIVESIRDSSDSLMIARYLPPVTLIGKAGSGISKGSSGTVTIWYDNAGTLAATTFTVTGYADGAAITASKFVSLTWYCGKWRVGCWET